MKNWEILTENEAGADDAAVEVAELAVLVTLSVEGVLCDGEISLVFVDSEAMRGINGQFRGKDAPTDCLSFPQLSADELENLRKPEFYAIFGDIIINIDAAQVQAAEFGHSIRREVAFLAAHSMLHLLGYDHEDGEAAEAEMFARQEAILAEMGLARSS